VGTSAVLIVNTLSPWNVATRDMILYVNPWAKRQVTPPMSELERTEIREGEITRLQGTHVKSLLSLPAGWPEDDAAA
jgi:hypothetical protein